MHFEDMDAAVLWKRNRVKLIDVAADRAGHLIDADRNHPQEHPPTTVKHFGRLGLPVIERPIRDRLLVAVDLKLAKAIHLTGKSLMDVALLRVSALVLFD